MAARWPERRARAWGASIALALIGGAAVSTAIGAPGDPADGTPISAIAAAQAGGTPRLQPTITTPPTSTTGPVPIIRSPPTTGEITRLHAAQVIRLPSNRRCVRRVRIRLLRPGGVQLRSLRIRLGTRRVTRVQPPPAITLGALPSRRFRLRVSVRAGSGQLLSRSRRYRPCAGT